MGKNEQTKFGKSSERNHDYGKIVRSMGRKARFGYPKRNANWEWQPPKVEKRRDTPA
jgi:hypothetical protein